MRGSVDGLGSSAPLGPMLPAVFADDDLAQKFVAGLDEVLAPVHNVLDCLDAYFTPSLAPADFTRWLGEWVGAETEGLDRADRAVGADRAGRPDGPDGPDGPGCSGRPYVPDRSQDTAMLRAAVAAAVHLHRIRGTRRGLAEALRLAFGVEPEITESGAAAWDARPLGPVPGERRPRLHVTVRLPDPSPSDEHRLESLVAAARPAHMPFTVQVTAAERTPDR
ncbi:phage tail protein [Streptomyces sp. NBC_01750]|uniref:phage tail protein n=1 Tax=Streptomyces sp. NBC_01750 TaxID=2975928 RepID=UPI002DDB9561|nr:phage tail protein [Streptomyces sp. NBC_01750]WSD35884.1 phage tail protein [Streptomyces sp. NBC_01750]